MLPLWAYIASGILCAFGFAAGIVLGVWLYEEHEDVFVTVMICFFLVVLGSLFGWMKYEDNLRKLHKPKPPAEAPIR